MLKFFKVNKTVSKSYPAGSVVQLLCDNKGVPVDAFWNQRYNDAKTDKCIEAVKIERPVPELKLETKNKRRKK
jgi:hypothetical protein